MDMSSTMHVATTPASATVSPVVSHEDALALLRLSAESKMAVDYLSAPSYVVRQAWRLMEFGMRLLPPNGGLYPYWGAPLDRAIRLHLMDGRDDAELARWESLTYDYPTNDEWGEVAAMLQQYVARLLEELANKGAIAGRDVC